MVPEKQPMPLQGPDGIILNRNTRTTTICHDTPIPQRGPRTRDPDLSPTCSPAAQHLHPYMCIRQMPVLLAITAIRTPLLIDDPVGLILGLWLAAGLPILEESPHTVTQHRLGFSAPLASQLELNAGLGAGSER
jgi:hypothetical protein